MIYAGIDEAGLGPVLGPLVVSAAAFQVLRPLESPAELWPALSPAVLPKPTRKPGQKVVLADSKKLFNRKKADGLVPLERGVLTMWMSNPSAGDLPETLADWLDTVAIGAKNDAAEYPWYGDCRLPLPRQAGKMDITLTANAVKVALREPGVSLVGLRSLPLLAGQYNRRIEQIKNKATVTFDQTASQLAWLWRSFPSENLYVTIDRQGGRTHYRPQLQRVFPECDLQVQAEGDELSAYRLADGERWMEVTFCVSGESVSPATALASMASKYLRELFMEMLNDFWRKHVDDLASTAGYYTDGNRFFAEIQPAMQSLNIPRDMILRSR